MKLYASMKEMVKGREKLRVLYNRKQEAVSNTIRSNSSLLNVEKTEKNI